MQKAFKSLDLFSSDLVYSCSGENFIVALCHCEICYSMWPPKEHNQENHLVLESTKYKSIHGKQPNPLISLVFPLR